MDPRIADSLVSIIVGLIVAIALGLVPLNSAKNLGRRVGIAVFFLSVGEVIVLVSDSGDWLRAALMLLEAAVLLLAEMAIGTGIFVGMLWIGCGVVGVWKWFVIGAWVAEHRSWVLIGAPVCALLCWFITSRRRRIMVDPYTMRGI